MVDKRSLLLGLGIGLIAGALLLQLMIAGKEQSEKLADIDKLSGEDALYTQSELDARIKEAEEKVRKEYEQAAAGGGETDADNAGDSPADDGADDGDAPSTGGALTGGDGGQAGEAPADDAGNGEAAGTEGGIEVRIKPGMTLKETARLLESAGVIDDAEMFMELTARMSTKIRAGYYTFAGSETPEEVRTIITSPPAK